MFGKVKELLIHLLDNFFFFQNKWNYVLLEQFQNILEIYGS